MYYFILISHILLSIIVIPLVLTSYTRAISQNLFPQEDFKNNLSSLVVCSCNWGYCLFNDFTILLMISYFQCSMCKAVLESGADQQVAESLNDGIVYLMAIPYILVALIGFLIYYKFLERLNFFYLCYYV